MKERERVNASDSDLQRLASCFKVARKRIRHKPGNKVVLALRKASGSSRSLAVPCTNELTTNFSSEVSTSSPQASPEKGLANNNGITMSDKDSAKAEILPRKKAHQNQRESLEVKRERKAAKTLAIITGVFVICWLPFFVVALLMPLCQSCRDDLPKIVTSTFLWLGYINSCVNPIICTYRKSLLPQSLLIFAILCRYHFQSRL